MGATIIKTGSQNVPSPTPVPPQPLSGQRSSRRLPAPGRKGSPKSPRAKFPSFQESGGEGRGARSVTLGAASVSQNYLRVSIIFRYLEGNHRSRGEGKRAASPALDGPQRRQAGLGFCGARRLRRARARVCCVCVCCGESTDPTAERADPERSRSAAPKPGWAGAPTPHSHRSSGPRGEQSGPPRAERGAELGRPTCARRGGTPCHAAAAAGSVAPRTQPNPTPGRLPRRPRARPRPPPQRANPSRPGRSALNGLGTAEAPLETPPAPANRKREPAVARQREDAPGRGPPPRGTRRAAPPGSAPGGTSPPPCCLRFPFAPPQRVEKAFDCTSP